MAWRIGIDIGGTFTDVALVEEATGRIAIAKLLTTPQDFGQAVIDGIRQGLDENRIDPADVSLLSHATTVVTNALLENKGARAGFVTTRGMRDILELRRSSRADLYDLMQDAPAVLVPRRWRFEITERIDAQGAGRDAARRGRTAGTDRGDPRGRIADRRGVLPVLIPERRARAPCRRRIARRVAGCRACICRPRCCRRSANSSAPARRRCAPWWVPCWPPISTGCRARSRSLGCRSCTSWDRPAACSTSRKALRMPAMAVESGPAAGVIAAALAGRQLGRPNLISFDMGGTTAKASVIANGEVSVTAEYEVGGAGHANRWMHGTGHPIRVPVIDLAEVSAGGGSIAWVDPGGALKVGPHSAGAAPGPAAYGAGGTLPTVTDADVVLGHLDREALLGGALRIDLAAAERAIDTAIARPLGLTVADAAARIVEVVNANMAQALRIVSIERGHDPQEFSLIAFGGAGPVHAVSLAEELRIPEVIVPPAPGAFSALGLVASDLKRDYSRTLYADLGSIDAGARGRRDRRHGAVGTRHAARRACASRAAGTAASCGRALSAAGVRTDGADR